MKDERELTQDYKNKGLNLARYLGISTLVLTRGVYRKTMQSSSPKQKHKIRYNKSCKGWKRTIVGLDKPEKGK